jgi:hypothetical protein
MAIPVQLYSGSLDTTPMQDGPHRGQFAFVFRAKGDLIGEGGNLTPLGRQLERAVIQRASQTQLIIGGPGMRRNEFKIAGWPELQQAIKRLSSISGGFNSMFT